MDAFSFTKNSSQINCTNITLYQGNIAALTRGVTGIVCFLLCLLALVFQVIYICHLRSTNTLQRLFLYLTIATVFYMGVLSLHIQHYFQFEGQETFCVVIGVLDQYTGSVQLLLTVGITLVLFHKLFSLSETYNIIASRFKLCNHPRKLKQNYCYEAILCITSLLLPWTVMWIPFFEQQEGAQYGNSGPWCWIQSEDTHTCHKIIRGILEQVLLWYAPFGLVAVISLLCIVCELVFFCYLRFYHGILEKNTRMMIKEILLLLTFLVVFCIVWLTESVIYGILNVPQIDVYSLWMVYAVITPIGGIVVPIGFFVNIFYSKFSNHRNHHEITFREYSNMPTGRDINRFIHDPSWVTPKSHTSDQDCKRFLTNKDEFPTNATDEFEETKALLGSTCTTGSRCNYLSTRETA